jgi:hypothetical protein
MCPAVIHVPMKRMAVAAVVSVLFILAILGGVYSLFSGIDIQGFAPEELHAPSVYTSSPLPDVPPVQGNVQTTPEVSLTILIGQVYKNYGGSVRLTLSNNDSRRLFIIDIGFEWVGSIVDNIHSLHEELSPGETVEIRAMNIEGPLFSGEQNYMLKIRALQRRAQGWFQITSGGDDWLNFPEHTTTVATLDPEIAYTLEYNSPHYFTKANDLIDFDEPTVQLAASQATAGIGTGYNIGKVCAIFDYVDSTLVYTDDPAGDLWYEPEVCLQNRAGDCEDYSLLIATMVHHAGGTARIYLTEGHAFAAVYVGNTTSELDQAANSVRSYYESEVKLLAFHDETGYWMFSDPLGSFHFGGLAVDTVPSADIGLVTNFTFEDTATVVSVDITGTTRPTTLLASPTFWMVLVALLGVLDIVVIIWASAEKERPKKCLVCNNMTNEYHYLCTCGQRYHHTCLPSQTFCLNCGAPIETGPPLPPVRPMH